MARAFQIRSDPGFHSPSQEIVGWKAIAAHLRVSIRTAQSLEKEHGLPVHRGAGQRTPVVALVAELEQWRGTRLSIETKGPQPAPEDSASVNRRRWMGTVLAGSTVFGLGGAGLGWAILRAHRLSKPNAFRIAGSTLIVLDEDGSEAWRHSFASPMNPEVYNSAFEQACVFADLNGDGRIETIFSYCPMQNDVVGYLVCFNHRGDVLWKFTPNGRIVEQGGREFLPPYYISAFAVVPRPGRNPNVVVSCNHHFSFPNHVVTLDSEGNVFSQYWHRGHLTHLATVDLIGHGEPAVLLGGVNDAPEYKQATLVVFDQGSIAGSSLSPRGDLYFGAVGKGTEKAEIFFPKTMVSRRQEFNRVHQIVPSQNRIMVSVSEGVGEAEPCHVIFELDFELIARSVTFSNVLRSKYVEMKGSSRAGEDAVRRDEDRFKTELRVIRRQSTI